jgi:hypothetical protein
MSTLAAPTLQNLITSVRNMLNQPNPQNSFWKDTELTEYLNEGVRIYFGEVVQNNEGLFTTTTDLNITSGTETVALPSDFFSIKNLWKKQSGSYQVLPYRNSVDEGYPTNGATTGDGYLPSYFFRSNNIVLRPVPNFSETAGLKIEYVQFPDTMVNGGDSLTTQVSPMFKQVIETYAVYKAKLKESLVTGVQVHAAAGELLGSHVKMLRDAIANRSKNPTYVIPFNPEEF